MENSFSEEPQADAIYINTTYQQYLDGIATRNITYSHPVSTEPYGASQKQLADAEGDRSVYDEDEWNSDYNNVFFDFLYRPPVPPPPPVTGTCAHRVAGFTLGPMGGYTFEGVINRLYQAQTSQSICLPYREFCH
jgi:hypothetical protein